MTTILWFKHYNTPRFGADGSIEAPGSWNNDQSLMAFDLKHSVLPLDHLAQIDRSAPVPQALSHPIFLDGRDMGDLKPQEPVVGILMTGQSRAYPLSLLSRHEIINDSIGNQPFSLIYCPRTHLIVAYDRRPKDQNQAIEFSVSGLIDRNQLLMSDPFRGRACLWSPITGQAVSGPRLLRKDQLRRLPVELTTWSNWLERFPDTLILSRESRLPRPYEIDPYKGYLDRPGLPFPMPDHAFSNRLPPKVLLLGVIANSGHAKAYPFLVFRDRAKNAKTRDLVNLQDQIGGLSIRLQYDHDHDALRVVQADPGLSWFYCLWFAWDTFYPGTLVYDRPS